MNNEESGKIVFDFISAHGLAVIATCSADGKPANALVAYAEKDGHMLIFCTDASTRKYANLQKNSQVAIVINGVQPTTLQYEGEATELAGGEAEEHNEILLQKHPDTAMFVLQPTSRTFLVKPRWARFTDFSCMPHVIVEWHFDSCL